MTPYGNIIFFIIIGILLLPTIILGLRGKAAKGYNIFISIVFLAFIFERQTGHILSVCPINTPSISLIRFSLTFFNLLFFLS